MNDALLPIKVGIIWCVIYTILSLAKPEVISISDFVIAEKLCAANGGRAGNDRF